MVTPAPHLLALLEASATADPTASATGHSGHHDHRGRADEPGAAEGTSAHLSLQPANHRSRAISAFTIE